MDVKPTSFQRAVPPEERNGFFGMEEDLIAAAADATPIVAVVTYVLDDVVQKVVKGETYPVVKAFSIEPLHDEDAVKTAVALRDAAMAARTGVEQLELPDIDDEGEDQ